ncbi:MAG: hypothetical protein HY397_02915 [Candidatus Doudnabacteria bacterium]|nr:hypothetical protein [Candidatus Doudnabacteria bacterium]
METGTTTPLVKVVKVSAVMLTVILVWLFLFHYTQIALTTEQVADWLLPAVLLVAGIPLTALAVIVVDQRLFFLLAVGLSFAYLAFFPLSLYALLAIALVFFGFWRAYHHTQFELHNNIKFAPNSVLRSVASIILLSYLLVVSFNVYGSIAGQLALDKSGFYSRLSRAVTKGVLPIIERELPGFDPGLTLDDYLITSFSSTLIDYETLPVEQQQQYLAERREQLMASLGIAANGDEPLSKVTELAVEQKIAELVEGFEKKLLPISAVLPAVYALAIFSLLRLLSVVVGLVSQAGGVALFWLLRLSGFLRVTTVEILAEHVEI